MRLTPSLLLLAATLLSGSPWVHAADATKPNVVYILTDDLGYGDVKCLNKDGKIATPQLDQMASEGMIFTDAHGSSAVCTPTRYSVLTGRYNWRTTLQSGVLMGDSPALIKQDQLTVATLLKSHGYHTACIGKWHLGMDMAFMKDGKKKTIDFTKPIENGPTTRGFDYYFGISASLDMPPFDYIENNRWTELATVEKKWLRQGPAAPDFEAVDVLPTLTRKAVAYIGEHAKQGGPFFLYLPLNSPHTPIVPSPEWKGKSGLNDYGDFVMETDWAIGEVLKALKKEGVAQNTLVIATSDNGCSPSANFKELADKGHHPSYVFRGMKSDIWDGGHHIPFIARWPGQIQPGSRSDELICLGDLLATCAEIVGTKLPDNAGEDSVSILPALQGKVDKPLHEAVVHHSIEGRFAIRQGPWKLELCPGSGGWSQPKDLAATKQGLPLVQLYDLSSDISEQHNVQAEHPEVVERLTKLLEKYIAEGRSTPGANQSNDANIDIWKKHLNSPKKATPKKNDEPVAN